MRRAWYRLKGLPERLRFRYQPHLAELILRHATRQARRHLCRDKPLQVLIDTNVLALAITHESQWVTTGVSRWGSDSHPTGHIARTPVHRRDNKSDDYLQVRYLTSIAYLARTGFIHLCTSAELQEERDHQPAGMTRGYGYFDYSLLSGIEMPSVDGDALAIIGPGWTLAKSRKQQQQRIHNAGNPLFQSLYDRLKHQLGAKKGTQDIWHIATAEGHGMYCFLTWDRVLIKAINSLSHLQPIKSLETKVMSPSDLGQAIGVRPVHPHFLSYNGASWFVRQDMNMPLEQRRKRGAYRQQQ